MCDYAEVFSTTTPKGRKQYRCGTCEYPIAAGESHSATRMKFDGVVSTLRQHFECVEAERAIYAGTDEPCALEYGFWDYIRESKCSYYTGNNQYITHPVSDYDKKARSLVAKAMWRSRRLQFKKQLSKAAE